MQKNIMRLAIVSLAGFAVTASAADTMKPGLWSIAVKSDALSKMPPMSAEQREQMKKMGVNMPEMKDGAFVQKMCITKEMASRDRMADMSYQKQTGCETKNANRNASGFSADIVCSGPNMKGTGTMKATSTGDSSFQSVYDFKGESHGHPVNQHQESTASWISADCGNIKPITEMTGKK